MPHPPLEPPAQRPAHQEEALLRLIADAVPAQMAYFDLPEGRCRFANQAYAGQNGFTPQSILGLKAEEIIGQQAHDKVRAHLDRCAQGKLARYTREHHLPNGEVRMIEVSLIPHLAEKPEPIGAFVLITDITERWRAERAVHQSAERMRKFSAATEESIVFHRDGIVLDGNEALTRLIGLPLPEMLGLSIFNFIHPEWRPVTLEYMRQAREDNYEIVILRPDGRTVPVEVVGKTMPDPTANYRVAVLRDITARKQAQEREEFASLHDPLTGLANRRLLQEHLAQTVQKTQQQQQRAAVLFVNLDHFKTINDSLGQHAGDALLREVAARISNSVGAEHLAARINADEFVLVLGAISQPEEACAAADRLLHAMQTPFVLDGQSVPVSLSIGISLCPDDGSTNEALLRNADTAMYHAKQTGRGRRALYHSAMDTRAMEVLERERALYQAIEQKAFELHYQPQVCLQAGTLQGFEALVRWRHPTRGLVGPSEFIAFAEARGLVAAIGRWVLHEACRQLKAWQDEGLARVPVAINLSGQEFRQRDLVREIADALQATGLEPQYLKIELTETVLMHHSSQVVDTLHALKALGVSVAVDDFGTGYSSLAYLKRYPIDQLKIDRSFVLDTPHSSDDVAIVTAIVQMGRSLHMQTVAEGVETAEQMALLRQIDCDLVQGFYIAQPMDAPTARSWMVQRSAP